jgi:hypothetical protein
VLFRVPSCGDLPFFMRLLETEFFVQVGHFFLKTCRTARPRSSEAGTPSHEPCRGGLCAATGLAGWRVNGLFAF